MEVTCDKHGIGMGPKTQLKCDNMGVEWDRSVTNLGAERGHNLTQCNLWNKDGIKIESNVI